MPRVQRRWPICTVYCCTARLAGSAPRCQPLLRSCFVYWRQCFKSQRCWAAVECTQWRCDRASEKGESCQADAVSRCMSRHRLRCFCCFLRAAFCRRWLRRRRSPLLPQRRAHQRLPGASGIFVLHHTPHPLQRSVYGCGCLWPVRRAAPCQHPPRRAVLAVLRARVWGWGG